MVRSLLVGLFFLLGICPLLAVSQPTIPTAVECATDTMECRDGSVVVRDPAMNCAFPSCDDNTTMTTAGCPRDIQACPDGSFVIRDPENGCQFPPCPPQEATTFCTADVQECSDRSFVSRDPENDCQFQLCPEDDTLSCTADVQECSDGSFVNRDPENDCQFPPCADDDIPVCTADVQECSDGSFVGRDPESNCQFSPCPDDDTLSCTADVQECPDGSFVSRDPLDICQFPPCPDDDILSCTADVQECSDGSFVGRDPENDCQFSPCSVCCSLAERPQFNIEEPICCPDGTWAGNIGNGSANCGADGLVNQSGPVCAPDCDVCPCGFNNGCNDCACIDDEFFGLVPGCTKRFCVPQDTTEPSCLECPTKPPPTLKPDISCEDCPCGFFDGCNTCGCTEGNAGDLVALCTLRACSIDELEPPRCNACPSPVPTVTSEPISPTDSRVNNLTCEDCPCGYHDGCNNCECNASGDLPICTLLFCDDDVLEEPRCTACPLLPPTSLTQDEISCDACPCGYFDGCNNCGCNDEGFPFCTQRACGIDEIEEVRCHTCPSPTASPLVSCDRCPCGYFDGCNQCHCEDDGGAFCTEIFCLEQTAVPQCNECPEDPRPCPKDARVCRDGTFVYRVAADGCAFESCPCNSVFCQLAQLFRAVLSFFRRRLRNS